MRHTNYSDDEDDEFVPTAARKPREDGVEVKPESILRYVRDKALDFSEPDSDEITDFCREFTETLNRQENGRSPEEPGNILHVLAEESAPKSKKFTEYWSYKRLSDFLGWVLQHHWSFLEIPIDRTSHFPLHTAFNNGNHVFIRLVLEFDELEKLKKVLMQKKLCRNYVQVALISQSPILGDIARKCTKLSLPVWSGQSYGKESETPLHLAVKKVYSGEMKQLLQNQLLCHGRKTVSPNEVADHLIGYLKGSQNTQDSMAQADIVKLFIDHYENALAHQSRRYGKGTKIPVVVTPYQLRTAQLRKEWDELIETMKSEEKTLEKEDTSEKAFRRVVIEDPVANTIKYHCLRNFDRDKITKCLYQPGEERHIDFDLAGLPKPSITKAFLGRLGKHLQFESILKYVALPKLARDDYNESEDGGGNASIPSNRRTLLDFREVFQWLRENQVKRILKVTVIDDGQTCHNDAIIEEALDGFQVEVWDWKKVNLCTDVIWNSTKVARHISLYSSCNNAVLMGWASSDGLGDRTKFPKLEHVDLFIGKGQETDERRTRYIKQFTDKISAMKISGSNNKRVAVKQILDDGKVSYAANFKNNEVPEQRKVDWISHVHQFAVFMSNMPKEQRSTIPPIKIAIVDDGVDSSLDILLDKIAGGKSFYPYANSSDLMNAYYVPSGQHGTMMADLICRTCPSCRLYVARLDEHPSRLDLSRQITTKSAAEAVEWAIDCQVDIISMSWTIEASLTDSKDLALFEDAISKAKGEEILMFCATSDQGSISSENCYPGKWGNCIRIGAATALGDKCTWVPDGHYDYLLPGKNIPFQWKRSDGFSSWYESGSSLSTALAAGLGGFLLYCNRVVHGKDSREFQKKTVMSYLFRKLAVTAKGTKYVRADNWFGKKFQTYIQQATNGRAATKSLSTVNASSEPLSQIPWSDTTRQALRSLLAEMTDEN